jgi:hypothetical protein
MKHRGRSRKKVMRNVLALIFAGGKGELESSRWTVGVGSSGFHEKPALPVTVTGDPEHSYASMGIYLFNTTDIINELKADSGTSSADDFGKNILSEMMKSGRVFAHEFMEKNNKEAKYWSGGVIVIPKGAEVR